MLNKGNGVDQSVDWVDNFLTLQRNIEPLMFTESQDKDKDNQLHYLTSSIARLPEMKSF